MSGSLRPKLTYANVLATCALFVALGGTGVAAVTQLANGSVKTSKIANGAVTGAKIAKGAVNATKIANGAVSATKIGDAAVVAGKVGPGAVGTNQLAAGAVGAAQVTPASLTADRFAPGVLGGVAASKVTVVAGTPVTVNNTNGGPGVTVTATCPPGQRAVGGGYDVGLLGFPDATGPTADGTGWMVVAEAGTTPATVSASVVCAAP